MQIWSRNAFILPCLALLAACASPQPFIAVNAEPKTHAWWLRIDMRPYGTAIRGIPVRKIDSKWCKANEFTLDLFPNEVRVGGDFPLEAMLKDSKAAFALSGQFGGSRILDLLVGVYETCSKKRGTFLIALEGSGASRRVVDVVQSNGSAYFAVLHHAKKDHVQIWWCFYCDHVSEFKWNNATSRFELEPEREHD
jgi:hypothetical protein